MCDKYQEQVIDCKDKQLQAVHTTVKSTVEDSVKEQFNSYSDAVQENVMVCKPDSDSLPVGKLKDVVSCQRICSQRGQTQKRDHIWCSGEGAS